MNGQILYATMTGHSKKIARAAASQTGFPIYDLKANPQIPPCDILYIVSGIYGGESKPELLSFVKTLSPDQIKSVALLTSSTKSKSQGSLKETLSNEGFTIIEDEFLCKGSFLFAAMGHPNKAESEAAVKFIKEKAGLK